MPRTKTTPVIEEPLLEEAEDEPIKQIEDQADAVLDHVSGDTNDAEEGAEDLDPRQKVFNLIADYYNDTGTARPLDEIVKTIEDIFTAANKATEQPEPAAARIDPYHYYGDLSLGVDFVEAKFTADSKKGIKILLEARNGEDAKTFLLNLDTSMGVRIFGFSEREVGVQMEIEAVEDAAEANHPPEDVEADEPQMQIEDQEGDEPAEEAEELEGVEAISA